MKKITLSPLLHRNQSKIAIHFTYDLEIKNHLKKLDFIKWSQTHKTFYAPFSTENKQILLRHLQVGKWAVDGSQLKGENPPPKIPKKKKNEPQKTSSARIGSVRKTPSYRFSEMDATKTT